MKKLFYLMAATVMLCTSCEEQTTPIGIQELRDPKNEMLVKQYFYDFEKHYKASLRNRVQMIIDSSGVRQGVLLSAVRDGKHWFGISKDDVESFIFEWYDTEPLTDTLHTVYIGYGETKTLHSEYLVPRLYKKYDNDEVLVTYLLNDDDINNASRGYYYGCFGNGYFDKTMIRVASSDHRDRLNYLASFIDKATGKKKKLLIEGNVNNGYNESIFTDNACISKGDTLFTYTTPNYYHLKPSEVELISYSEGVNVFDGNSVEVYYADYKNNISKEFNINPPFEIPSDAQPKFTATYKGYENRKLHYIVDVVYFDGTKKQFSVSINVDTDEITTV